MSDANCSFLLKWDSRHLYASLTISDLVPGGLENDYENVKPCDATCQNVSSRQLRGHTTDERGSVPSVNSPCLLSRQKQTPQSCCLPAGPILMHHT